MNKSCMKIALVHDYLNQYGGAERVLEVLLELFPKADLYTIFHDAEKTKNRFQNRVTKTSFLDFPLARNRHRLFIPLMPLAAASLNLGSRYDLIISNTPGYAKGVRYDKKTTKHVSYIHTPIRYAWEAKDYLPALLSPFQLFIAEPVIDFLKWWDRRTAQNPNLILANSQHIAGKIKSCYGRDSTILYPPVDTKTFCYDSKSRKLKAKSYYLAVGRLLHYKRFDLIVDAFIKLGFPLKIVGIGTEQENLKIKIQNAKVSNIEMLGSVSDEELKNLYNNAKAFIFPQVEDFGLVAAEAQSCGTPVIAYAAGGALEIIQDGKTGLLFKEQTAGALAAAVIKSAAIKFNRKTIAQSAQRFSKEKFTKNLQEMIASV